MKLARSTVMAITALGIGACDGGGNAGPDAPAIDGPLTDGPPLDGHTDGPVDGPVDGGPVDLRLTVAGTGAGVIYTDPLNLWCASQDCTSPFTHRVGDTYAFHQEPIAGSTFSGWSGCAPQPDGTCTVTLTQDTVVTATYDAPSGVSWVRSAWPLYISDYRIFLDATADGVVASGTGRDYASGGPWIARYLADGTQISDGISWFDPLLRPALAHGVNAGGAHWFLLAEPPPGSPPGTPERPVLRRVPGPVSAVAGGTVGNHGLAVDDAGNAYVSGISGGVAYLASYDPTGTQRWRITPPGVTEIQALLVRGNLLVAGGSAPGWLGWLGTYDLAGAPGWSRTVTLPMTASTLAISALDIDSDGDVLYGGRATNTYVAGAVSADGATEPWQLTFASRTAGAVAVHPDDSVRVWVGSATPSSTPSALHHITETGIQGAVQTLPGLPTPSAIVIRNGTTYLAGPHAGPSFASRRPAIVRLP